MNQKNKPSSFVLPAYAKVNLHLNIKGKSRSGYHVLETLFQEISLCDTLHFSLTDGPILLDVEGQSLSAGPDNLVVRALAGLKKKIKTKWGMHVRLSKNIPIGAGLGGGSSDAAAALRGGWMLWKQSQHGRHPSKNDRHSRMTGAGAVPPVLHELGRKLGADVPFFLRGGRAWAEGIGDKLTSLPPAPKKWMVLIYPRVAVSTGEAYALLDKSREKTRSRETLCLMPVNSFEPVILSQYPRIARAHRALVKAGGTSVMLSGSGSTVFGLTENRIQAERIQKSLVSSPFDVFVAHTR